ncbi:MAG: sigma-70 family RNA polymerase sigma factor [Firmicutes bacterium]|nr:sigma-70 family RNA polymerase sigma factor [Bacillota bacterium]
MLSYEQTMDLVARAKNGSDSAKETLITTNAPLIKSIIKRYVGKGVDYDDLYQLGALGFVKAINKYDPSYNVKFTTYAVPLIAGEVKRFLRDDGTIKVSRSTKTLYTKIKRFLATRVADEHQPTIDQIAVELDVSREDVVFAIDAANYPLDLFDKGEGGESVSLAEKIPITSLTDLGDKIMIRNMLEALDIRDRKVIILRYFRNQTQAQVAEKLGISQVQVSRIEQRILQSFRDQLREEEA